MASSQGHVDRVIPHKDDILRGEDLNVLTGYPDTDLPVLPEDAPASPAVSPLPGSSSIVDPVETGYTDTDLPVLPEDIPSSPVVSLVPDSSSIVDPVKTGNTDTDLPVLPEDIPSSPVVSLVPDSSSIADPVETGDTDTDLPVLPEDIPSSPVVSLVPDSSPTASPVNSRPPPAREAISNRSTTSLLTMSTINMSTASLALTEQTTAHSGHSHLRDNVQKEKIKRRSSVASLFLNRGKDKTKDKEEDKEDGNKKRAWLLRLNQKKNKYMDRLLRVGDDEKQGEMKWDDFLKVMHDMGFGYDSSTAGSSVRFDPPVKGDRSITFHMPHPRHTLSHKQVKEFGKKLKKYYGWDEDLLKQAAAAAAP